VVSVLTEHGLIDEYMFVVGPTVLGSGRPLVSGVSGPRRLDLRASHAFPTGNVLLRYARRE
jgi:riboflavin biosynthesis pyrimidine reductase